MSAGKKLDFLEAESFEGETLPVNTAAKQEDCSAVPENRSILELSGSHAADGALSSEERVHGTEMEVDELDGCSEQGLEIVPRAAINSGGNSDFAAEKKDLETEFETESVGYLQALFVVNADVFPMQTDTASERFSAASHAAMEIVPHSQTPPSEEMSVQQQEEQSISGEAFPAGVNEITPQEPGDSSPSRDYQEISPTGVEETGGIFEPVVLQQPIVIAPEDSILAPEDSILGRRASQEDTSDTPHADVQSSVHADSDFLEESSASGDNSFCLAEDTSVIEDNFISKQQELGALLSTLDSVGETLRKYKGKLECAKKDITQNGKYCLEKLEKKKRKREKTIQGEAEMVKELVRQKFEDLVNEARKQSIAADSHIDEEIAMLQKHLTMLDNIEERAHINSKDLLEKTKFVNDIEVQIKNQSSKVFHHPQYNKSDTKCAKEYSKQLSKVKNPHELTTPQKVYLEKLCGTLEQKELWLEFGNERVNNTEENADLVVVDVQLARGREAVEVTEQDEGEPENRVACSKVFLAFLCCTEVAFATQATCRMSHSSLS